MAKFYVTPQLAYTIRTARTQKKITSKAVADHLQKSQAYMSKLEKGEIKTIDEEVLSSIFLFIFKDENNTTPSLDDILEKIYSILELQYNNNDIAQEIWLYNYDTVARSIPIPKDLAKDFSKKMEELDLSVPELCRRINANEGLPSGLRNKNDLPYNEWTKSTTSDGKEYIVIRLLVNESEITGILSGEIDSENYFLIYAISYYLHKIQQYGSQVVIPEVASIKLLDKAKDYLKSFQFLTIFEKCKSAKQVERQIEWPVATSSFDGENQELILKLFEGIEYFSELDKTRKNKILSSLTKNLNWDLGFIFSMIGLNFYELGDLSYSKKTQLITEIYQLIKKYRDLPEQQKTLDLYDLP